MGTYLIGALVFSVVTPKLSTARALLVGIVSLIVVAIAIFVDALYFPLSITSVVLPMALYTFAVSCMSSQQQYGCNASVDPAFRGWGGTSGVLALAGAAIFSAVGTAMPHNTLMPLAIYVGVVAVLAAVIYFSVLYSESNLPKSP